MPTFKVDGGELKYQFGTNPYKYVSSVGPLGSGLIGPTTDQLAPGHIVLWQNTVDNSLTWYANVNGVIRSISGGGGSGGGFSGNYNDLFNKPVLSPVPTILSAFANDVGFTTLNGAQIAFDGRYVRLSGTYFNPDWLGSIDWTKITQSASARFITDVERTTWNSKQNALGFTPYNATNPLGFQTASDVNNAIAGKQNNLSLTTTGSGAATFNQTTGQLNIPTSPGGSGATDSLVYATKNYVDPKLNSKVNTSTYNTNRTADQNVVAGKEPAITAGSAGQYWRWDKTWQTLNQDAVPDGTNNKAYTVAMRDKLAGIAPGATNVDSTLNVRKTTYNSNRTIDQNATAAAQTAANNAQTAANGKAPLASPAFTGVPTVPTAATNATGNQAASLDFVKNVVAGIPAGGGDATTTTAQTFQNKTLVSPSITGVADSDSTDKAATIGQLKRLIPRFSNFPFDNTRLAFVGGNLTIEPAAEQAVIDARIAASASPANVNRTITATGGGTSNLFMTNLPTPVLSGTATVRNPAATNAFTQTTRVGYVSTAAAVSYAGIKTSSAVSFFGQNQVVTFAWGFADATLVPAARSLVGLFGATSYGNVNPSTLVNVLGFGSDSGDSNLSFFRNDGTGTAVKTDLGSNFPAQTSSTDFYKGWMILSGNGTSVTYYLKNTNNGAIATATVTNELPTNVAAYFHFSRQTVTATDAVAIDISLLTVRTEF